MQHRRRCEHGFRVAAEQARLSAFADTKYSHDWRAWLEREGVEVIRLRPRSPNLNAYAERFVRSIKDECLNRMIFIGEASLGRAISAFMIHYHEERNHQGLGNRLIRGKRSAGLADAPIQRRVRLGGMLSFYHHAAA